MTEPMNKERLIYHKAWLGVGNDLRALDENVESEIWFHIRKDEHSNETLPYTLRASITPGKLETMFTIEKASNFEVQLMTFPDEASWKLYDKEDSGYDELNHFEIDLQDAGAAESREFIKKLILRRREK